MEAEIVVLHIAGTTFGHVFKHLVELQPRRMVGNDVVRLLSHCCRHDSWEQKLAQALEDMAEVVRYVKNHNLGFMIPYSLGGEGKNYVPDFIACIDDGHGPETC